MFVAKSSPLVATVCCLGSSYFPFRTKGGLFECVQSLNGHKWSSIVLTRKVVYSNDIITVSNSTFTDDIQIDWKALTLVSRKWPQKPQQWMKMNTASGLCTKQNAEWSKDSTCCIFASLTFSKHTDNTRSCKEQIVCRKLPICEIAPMRNNPKAKGLAILQLGDPN